MASAEEELKEIAISSKITSKIEEVWSILKGIEKGEREYFEGLKKLEGCKKSLKCPTLFRKLFRKEPNPVLVEKLQKTVAFGEEEVQNKEENVRTKVQSFEKVLKDLEKVLNSIRKLITEEIGNLERWKHQEQLKLIGLTLPQNKIQLKTVEKRFREMQKWLLDLKDLQTKGKSVLSSQYLKALKPTLLGTLKGQEAEVEKLLGEVIGHSLVVEGNPPGAWKKGAYLKDKVTVSLLLGDLKEPVISTKIISEDVAKKNKKKMETSGRILNGEGEMKFCGESGRYSITFLKMRLMDHLRLEKLRRRGRGNYSDELAMEQKHCLYFTCKIKVAGKEYKISTMSLPLVITTHSNQDAVAMIRILYDRAFSQLGREPFAVPDCVFWRDFMQVLNAQFKIFSGVDGGSGRGLDLVNLECLRAKAFPNQEHEGSYPTKISWNELCKIKLPGRKFTFWEWIYFQLKLLQDNAHLKTLWNAGLIMGQVHKEKVIRCLNESKPGTFLIRFPDSVLGHVTIELFLGDGKFIAIQPETLNLTNTNLAMVIKCLPQLKYLYRGEGMEPLGKDEAFGRFYDEDEAGIAKSTILKDLKVRPYVSLRPSLPENFADFIIQDKNSFEKTTKEQPIKNRLSCSSGEYDFQSSPPMHPVQENPSPTGFQGGNAGSEGNEDELAWSDFEDIEMNFDDDDVSTSELSSSFSEEINETDYYPQQQAPLLGFSTLQNNPFESFQNGNDQAWANFEGVTWSPTIQEQQTLQNSGNGLIGQCELNEMFDEIALANEIVLGVAYHN